MVHLLANISFCHQLLLEGQGTWYKLPRCDDNLQMGRLSRFLHNFTCNLNWSDIKRFMDARGLKPKDHPDIIAKVFNTKLRHLLKDFKYGKIFEKVKVGMLNCYIFFFIIYYILTN